MTSATNALPLPTLAHFGFLTLPGFSMIAFTSAVEVLHMANCVDRAQHYRWSVLTSDGVPVRASNGITLEPASTLEEAGRPDVLIVCGGTQIRSAVDSSIRELLGDVAEQGAGFRAMPSYRICHLRIICVTSKTIKSFISRLICSELPQRGFRRQVTITIWNGS